MPIKQVFDMGGLNLYINPLARNDGEALHLLNVDNYPYGAKSKRPGYISFLGTANGSAVTNLWSWEKNNGDLFLYRESGGVIFYSINGTGAWTTAVNGTVTAGNYIGNAVLDDTMVICDGAGSTRHTTNGTSFTNTTLAPVAVDVVQYQNRIHALGTSSDDFYSTTNDATNWATTGTSDSSSIKIPGGGRLLKGFVAGDRLILNKTSGKQFKFDGFSLVDSGSTRGVTSPWSVDDVEGSFFYLNRLGINVHGGGRSKILSNPIQPQIYNKNENGIVGTVYDNAGGGVYRHDYLLSVGTTTDDYCNRTINDNIIAYDYQTNEYRNWNFYHKPNVFHSYKDINGDEKLIFGGANGQVYQLSGTATSDAGFPIKTEMEFLITAGAPKLDKSWDNIDLFLNPGCNAQVQVAISDNYIKNDENKKWESATGLNTGTFSYDFIKGENRGKFLYVKISEKSTTSKTVLYGYAYNAEFVGHK